MNKTGIVIVQLNAVHWSSITTDDYNCVFIISNIQDSS